MRVIADITDPDIIQKILDHIEAQPLPFNSEKTALNTKGFGVGVKYQSETSRFCRNVAFYSGTLLRPHQSKKWNDIKMT